MLFPIIKLKDIEVISESKHNPSTILKNITFDIYEGEFLSIIGPSGSGKTSILFTIAGLFEPTKGIVSFKHKKRNGSLIYLPILKYIDHFRARIGFSFEEPSLYHDLTVKENLDYFAGLYLKDKRRTKKVSELIKRFSLESIKDKIVEELSGSELKKLDLACSLVNNPRILLLDEPTANLDSKSKREIWMKIKELNDSGITIIATTHSISEIEAISDRIISLKNGTVIDSMTPTEIISKYSQAQGIVIETMSENLTVLKGLISKECHNLINKIKLQDEKVVMTTSKPHELISSIMKLSKQHNIRIISLNYTEMPLDELFDF